MTLQPTADISAQKTPNGGGGIYARFGKRLFDIVFVLLVLPFAIPLALLIALSIWLDGGHIIETERYFHRNRRMMKLFSFRVMVPNAQARLEEYFIAHPEFRKSWQHAARLETDPRLTPLGRYLRRSGLEDLPQLFNLLRGDLSLVGPSPEPYDEQRGSQGETGNGTPEKPQGRQTPGLTRPWRITSVQCQRTSHMSASPQSLRSDLRAIMVSVGRTFGPRP